MNQTVRHSLEHILEKLAQECEGQMGRPVKCELTPKGREWSFMIPNSSRKQRIAGGGVNSRHSLSHGKDRPCAIVAVQASLLNHTHSAYVVRYIADTQWGRQGRGEVHIAVCRIGDSDYGLALKSLTEAATNLLVGRRFPW